MLQKLSCFLLTVSVLLSLSVLSSAAVGYDAETARESAYSGDPVVNIRDYDGADDIEKAVWYGIYDPEGLCWFANLINNTVSGHTYFRSTEVRVCLCASLDMSDVAFTPIGTGSAKYTKTTPSASFQGTFDGRGYTIDNLTVTPFENASSSIAYASLFGSVGENARIRDLVIGSGCVFAYAGNLNGSCAASLVSRAAEGAVIEQILNLAPVSGATACGGIVARAEGYWTAEKVRVANQSPVTVRNCTNRGAVSGTDAVGGILGQARGNVAITSCVSSGALSGSAVGGALGRATECVATGESGASAVSVTLTSIRANGPALVGNTGASATVTPTDCSLTADPGTPPETDEERLGVRFHGVQIAIDNADRVSVRFVASVDNGTTYTAVGFRLTSASSGTINFPCTVLFTSLLGQAGDDTVVYTAEQLRGAEGYLFAASLTGAQMTVGDQFTCSVAAYAATAGGNAETIAHTLTLTKTEGGCTVTWIN